MAVTFLNGPQHDFVLDRDTAFTVNILQVGEETMTAPTMELIRSRTSRLPVDAALIPAPTTNGQDYTWSMTEDEAGALADLAGDSRVVYLKYRMRATVNGAVRTLLCGRMTIGPVGYGTSSQTPTFNLTLVVGDIVFGDTASLPDPEDPEDPESSTPANATMWDTDDYEMWDTDDYVVWA